MMKVLWSEQMIVNLLRHRLLAAGAGLLLGLAGNVAWAQNYVNATVDGQTTAHYIADALDGSGASITTLARGVPVGGELDYLDDGTIQAALRARRQF